MRWGVQEVGRGKWGADGFKCDAKEAGLYCCYAREPGKFERTVKNQYVRIWWLHKMVQGKKPAPRKLLDAIAQLCTDDRVNLRDGQGRGCDWDRPNLCTDGCTTAQKSRPAFSKLREI